MEEVAHKHDISMMSSGIGQRSNELHGWSQSHLPDEDIKSKSPLLSAHQIFKRHDRHMVQVQSVDKSNRQDPLQQTLTDLNLVDKLISQRAPDADKLS